LRPAYNGDDSSMNVVYGCESSSPHSYTHELRTIVSQEILEVASVEQFQYYEPWMMSEAGTDESDNVWMVKLTAERVNNTKYPFKMHMPFVRRKTNGNTIM
jgi:hypothetical protein